jgi:uncharacterized protein YxjI
MQSPGLSTLNNPFGHQKYLLKKRILIMLGAKLNIYDPSGNMVMVVQQKAFKLREDIRVYSDEGFTQEVLSIKARKIMDFSAAYDVVDPIRNEKVGVLRRKGWSSIVRDNWEVLDATDVKRGEITEDNMMLALIRRLLTNLVPQNYDMVFDGTKVADFGQGFNPFAYHLNIDFSMDSGKKLDPRLGIAAAVLLATLEGRQS